MFSDEIEPLINIYLKTLDKSKITKIIKYATEGGKCIRGFIVKHIIEELGICNTRDIWGPVTAVELIHAASLVIDDLPCMDDDLVRRGKKAVFVQFGKQEAILSTLFIIAESIRLIFETLEKYSHTNKTSILIREWCNLLSRNLVIGQFMDLKGDVELLFNIKQTENKSDSLIRFKTGALFSFAFLLGSLFTQKTNIDDFKEMGIQLGFMYQIMDDYKDKEKDDINANYILSMGIKKTVKKYREARMKLIILLQKNELYTPKFRHLIEMIDNQFPLISEKNSELPTYH